MFDIMRVAKTIKEARIARDMTQMNLADAMEVSYQAVSNWERGNSMPDIAKLEQLCQILQISIDQLLGMEDEAKTVRRIMQKDEAAIAGVTMKEIENIAPLLPPKEVTKLVNMNLHQNSRQEAAQTGKEQETSAKEPDQQEPDEEPKRKKTDRSILAALAPFLGTKDLDEILQELEEELDMKTIISLAPFLSSRSIDALVLRLTGEIGMEKIRGLLPFVSQGCLEELLARCEESTYLENVKALAPFLSSEFLMEVIRKA